MICLTKSHFRIARFLGLHILVDDSASRSMPAFGSHLKDMNDSLRRLRRRRDA